MAINPPIYVQLQLPLGEVWEPLSNDIVALTVAEKLAAERRLYSGYVGTRWLGAFANGRFDDARVNGRLHIHTKSFWKRGRAVGLTIRGVARTREVKVSVRFEGSNPTAYEIRHALTDPHMWEESAD